MLRVIKSRAPVMINNINFKHYNTALTVQRTFTSNSWMLTLKLVSVEPNNSDNCNVTVIEVV